MFIFERERERERESHSMTGGETEREGTQKPGARTHQPGDHDVS